MNANPANPGQNIRAPVVPLRILAIPVLALWIVEVVLGNTLALDGSPYPSDLLIGHVLVAILAVLLTGFAVGVAFRSGQRRGLYAAGVTHGSTLAATISGLVFLFAGQNQYALDGMEGFAGVMLLGIILMALFGRAPSPTPVSAP